MKVKMFEKGSVILLTLSLFISGSLDAWSQKSTDNVNISFGIKSWDPVKIFCNERVTPGNEFPVIHFTATNSTYYPFSLRIEFKQFENLTPRPSARPFKVIHGKNNLFTCTGHIPGRGYSYSYSYSYWLAPSEEVIREDFPYLIPLAEGKRVNAKTTYSGRMSDSFTGARGDTVYCMRRGIVTAVPRHETLDFRLSSHDCLEVLHDDGTIMVYHNLAKGDNMTAPAQVVIPGQPIATMSDSSYIWVTLMKIEQTANLVTNPGIKYSTATETPVSYEDLEGKGVSSHPSDIIILEMKGSEIKRAGKGKKN